MGCVKVQPSSKKLFYFETIVGHRLPKNKQGIAFASLRAQKTPLMVFCGSLAFFDPGVHYE
jgi:hypothetical protein